MELINKLSAIEARVEYKTWSLECGLLQLKPTRRSANDIHLILVVTSSACGLPFLSSFLYPCFACWGGGRTHCSFSPSGISAPQGPKMVSARSRPVIIQRRGSAERRKTGFSVNPLRTFRPREDRGTPPNVHLAAAKAVPSDTCCLLPTLHTARVLHSSSVSPNIRALDSVGIAQE